MTLITTNRIESEDFLIFRLINGEKSEEEEGINTGSDQITPEKEAIQLKINFVSLLIHSQHVGYLKNCTRYSRSKTIKLID